jgi:hypothetical protein
LSWNCSLPHHLFFMIYFPLILLLPSGFVQISANTMLPLFIRRLPTPLTHDFTLRDTHICSNSRAPSTTGRDHSAAATIPTASFTSWTPPTRPRSGMSTTLLWHQIHHSLLHSITFVRTILSSTSSNVRVMSLTNIPASPPCG